MPDDAPFQPDPLPDVVPPWVKKPKASNPAPVPARVPTASHPFRFHFPPVESLQGTIPGYEFLVMFNNDERSAIYRARQPHLDRDVAIKILPPVPSRFDKREYIRSFEEEARTMAKLNHPNIVKVFDFGATAKGLPYFAMEYVEGAILGPAIRSGQMTVDHVVSWAPQICDALQYAHEMGIVHGGVCPSNVLLTQDGEVKLINFGLNRIRGQGPEPAPKKTTGYSADSAAYMAPEILANTGAIDYRVDIYSVGAVLHEMLLGAPPRGAWEPPPATSGLDPRFDGILAGSLASDPASRFQSVMEISVRLYDLVKHP